jgi:hypothetical protein
LPNLENNQTFLINPYPSPSYLSQDLKPAPQRMRQIRERGQAAHQEARLLLTQMGQLSRCVFRLQAASAHRDSPQSATELEATHEEASSGFARGTSKQVAVVVEEQGLQVRVVRQQSTNHCGVAGV